MTVTITSVSGSGGNPPTSISVVGTMTNCENVSVKSSCSHTVVTAHGPNKPWSVDLPNDAGCHCGDDITVTVWCGLGTPSADQAVLKVALPCDDCPSIKLSADPAGPCVNGKRQVTIHAMVNSFSSPTIVQWDFSGSNNPSTTAFSLPGTGSDLNPTVTYTADPSAQLTEIVTLKTISPHDCPDFTTTVLIDPCPMTETNCCPVDVKVDISAPSTPGGAATLKATIEWPKECRKIAPAPIYYVWTITSGQDVFTRNAPPDLHDPSQCTVVTSAGWFIAGATAAAAVPLASGGYSVVVDPIFSGPTVSCPPRSGAGTFEICPQLIGPLNASADPSNACLWTFSAQVDNPGNAPVGFSWTFQDGTTATSSVPQITHTYPVPTTGSGTTTLTMTSAGCPDQKLQKTVTPTCGSASKIMPPSTATACPWWCLLLGIVAIAIPISAYISSTGTCYLPPLGAAFAAFGIGLAIVIFSLICSVCCLWIIIVIGIILGIVAWIIAAIIMAVYGIYPNAGCVALGVALIISFAVMAYAFWLACQALSMSSSGSSPSPSGDPGPKKHQNSNAASAATRDATPNSAPGVARVGLGDVISGAASALGIQPCAGCRQRAQALNALGSFPVKRRA